MPGDIILLYIHVYQKWRSYHTRLLKYKVWQTEIFDILGHFLPFQPLDNLENQNFNIEKNTWRYYHFTHLHHKWQSYDIWFQRYGVQLTELFVILEHFLPFYLAMDPENQILEKWKKHLTIISFYKCVPSRTVIWCTVPELWTVVHKTEFFCHFGLFFALYPPNKPKN